MEKERLETSPTLIFGTDIWSSQYRAHVDIAMDVVGETVQQKHDLAIAWTSFVVGDLERISADGSQGFEPWQRSAHHGTWVLTSHRSFLVSFYG
jgi:hypothetical protein